jgi:glutaredoxin 3
LAGRLELYGTRSCPFTAELREQLEWDGREFADYDVEADAAAWARLTALTGGQAAVPVLVEDGRVAQIGWQGRSCLAQVPQVPEAPPGAACSGPPSSPQPEDA